ncbi:putative inorganic phosphate cotransporter [Teleopsis dalmanni]|uniref:putative inorganic phosphate cotransporter n=1 Tax=Teleopsis dalmanni TaxID=139649 RepID=UPI0018CEC19E|nr:putative inorganic phosphate cotransporter [Teleopsis dalmanni]
MLKNRRFEDETKAPILGVRHLQCLLLFTGLAVAFAMRVNFSMAIVAMTDNNSTSAAEVETYQWTEKTKSMLLSSFFWGYVFTQVPSGQLARKFGGKTMLVYGLLMASILTILTPMAAKIGNWQLVCASRFFQGLSQGVFFPSTHTIISQWAPLEERGLLGAICYSGSQFGTVVMLAVSGIMASSDYGWPCIFYASGAAGIVWVFIWYIWGASTPSECKSISAEEKNLIESSLGRNEDEPKKLLPIPWSKIFTSLPFLVLCLVHCTHNWGFWTLLIEIPTYMKNVLGMNIKSNALLSALPYLVMMLLSYVFGIIAMICGKRKYISTSVNRKLFNTIGQWVPVVTLICLGYLKPGQTSLAVVLLTITVGVNSATFLGFKVNHIDLSPNFAGVLMGITNCAANIMSFLAPLAVGFIVTDEKNPVQWSIVFFIAAFLYFIGNLLFIIFGKTNIQIWNDLSTSQDLKKNNNNNVELQ